VFIANLCLSLSPSRQLCLLQQLLTSCDGSDLYNSVIAHPPHPLHLCLLQLLATCDGSDLCHCAAPAPLMIRPACSAPSAPALSTCACGCCCCPAPLPLDDQTGSDVCVANLPLACSCLSVFCSFWRCSPPPPLGEASLPVSAIVPLCLCLSVSLISSVSHLFCLCVSLSLTLSVSLTLQLCLDDCCHSVLMFSILMIRLPACLPRPSPLDDPACLLACLPRPSPLDDPSACLLACLPLPSASW
jgi:hypothetical protein